MFHLDHVNRLPKQTQRHVYGCTAPAKRRSGGGVKIFHWGVSPSKSLNTAITSIVHIQSFELTSNHPSSVPPPFYKYYIHRTAQQLYIYANNPRFERSKGPLFQYYLIT
jgi:hypothetical protein